MLVIPAIDLKGARCVRLQQGEMSKETVYSTDPERMAVRWFEQGAERLHLVDLDGAVSGRAVNKGVIGAIVQAVPIAVQVGGGIRNLPTIEAYLGKGAEQVILGTVAYKDPEFLIRACEEFPGHILLGIDARRGSVAVEGWTQETELTVIEMAQQFQAAGISGIIYTDILRDGMGTGPNLEATAALAKAVDVPVIASGGICGIKDVAKVLRLEKYGVTGMITGRALYEGNLDLTEAIALAKGGKERNSA